MSGKRLRSNSGWIAGVINFSGDKCQWSIKPRTGDIEIILKNGMPMILDGIMGHVEIVPVALFVTNERQYNLHEVGINKPCKVYPAPSPPTP